METAEDDARGRCTLQAMGWLHRDAALGRLSFAVGALLMFAALAWGAAVVWRNYVRGGERRL